MRTFLNESRRELITRTLNPFTALCGASALALLVIVVGWPLETPQRILVRACTHAVLVVFVVQEIIRLLVQEKPLRFFRMRLVETTLALLAGAELLFGDSLLAWLGEQAPDLPASTITVLYLAGAQLTLVIMVGLRALRSNSLLSGRRLSPGMVFILSFAALIAIGTFLLKTPQATPGGGKNLGWIDAAFTATSAVCVTGLVTVDMQADFTRHGQWIVLGLIQIGGLGVMTITYFFAYFFAGGVSLRNRVALQDLLSEENLGHIGTVLGVIVGFTLITELAGAFLIHTSLAGVSVPDGDLLFFSVFHSVSAFCNAGFSTVSAGLADPALSGRTGFLSVVMALIVGGGIGFPVVKNAWLAGTAGLARILGMRIASPPRLTANSRIVLATTALLLAGGTVAVWTTEFAFGTGPSNGNAWFTALFHAVTARTAGFGITPMHAMMPATAVCMMFLMFVGGSPSSTAGGIKTTTLAVACLALRRVILGRDEIEAYGRRFGQDIANRALTIVLLSAGLVTAVTVALSVLHPSLPVADLAFEAVSAVSTVGLTRGITPALGDPAKLVLIAAMFIGRVGVLLFVLSFVRKRSGSGYRLPETSVVLS